MFTALWIRFQPWVAAAGLALGALVSAFVVGRKSGGERVRAQAAATEQEARRDGDAAARDAERTGASDRLRSGSF
jgi:hypothetical protein